MNQIITPKAIDFNELVKNSNTTLSLNVHTKMIDKLSTEFTEKEQQWYIANLYMYMNYHPTDDYPINLEDVFKMIGFAHKKNAKRTLENNFTENDDYKINVLPREHGRFTEETIMLNIDTFKNLCMMAKTDKGKEIRKYYVKLENIYNQIIKEEIEEQQREIEEQQKEIKERDKFIETIQNKPDTIGFLDRKPGYNYIIKDRSRLGHYKIGFAIDTYTRLIALNTSSSTCSLEIVYRTRSLDKELSEKIIHSILQPFRIRNDNQRHNEWFYFKDDFELAFAVKALRSSVEFTNSFIYKDYNHFLTECKAEDVTNSLYSQNLKSHSDSEQVTDTAVDTVNDYVIKKNNDVTFRGANWVEEKKKWKAEFQYKSKRIFLGYFIDQVDAAKTYNDYVLYLNETEDAKLILNEIPGYKTTPRNVPDLNKIHNTNAKSSKWNGVSYDTKRRLYVTGVKFRRKTYNIGSHQDEIECAKLYNQQALFFNNTFNTNYELNDIDNYVAIPKDFRDIIKPTKTSRYHGVSLTRTGKWACSYMINKKKIHIGTFNTELEACAAYNKVVIELNKNGCDYVVNQEQI